MSKSKILVQLDTDPQPSVFDSVVAIDAGAGQLLRHSGVRLDQVQSLVHGAMFTRGMEDLRSTAIFVGGSDVSAGEALLAEVQRTFFGPMRVSVMMDCNGANTTAAAAVLTAGRHVSLSGTSALVLGATGAVGQRVARLLAGAGAKVRVASRDLDRAEAVCARLRESHPQAQLSAVGIREAAAMQGALEGVQVLITAGAAGVQLLSEEDRIGCKTLEVAIDLNAVPPLGLAGIGPQDKGVKRGSAASYGALGVGGTKMKIHKAALRRLFESNDQVLDAEQIYQLGSEVAATSTTSG